MAQLFDITRIDVGPKYLTCHIVFAEGAPQFTDDNPEATQLVLDKLPDLAGHVCLGDGGETFGEVAQATSIAHLFEHTSIELMARTGMAGDITSGKTRASKEEENAYDIRLMCPDDVLTVGALSSAAFILDWAYAGGGEPEPGIDAIVSGLQELVESVSEEELIEEPLDTEFFGGESFVEGDSFVEDEALIETEGLVEGDAPVESEASTEGEGFAEETGTAELADADDTVVVVTEEGVAIDAAADETQDATPEDMTDEESSLVESDVQTESVLAREPGSVSVIAPVSYEETKEVVEDVAATEEEVVATAEAVEDAVAAAAEATEEAEDAAAEAVTEVIEEAELTSAEDVETTETTTSVPKPIFTAGPSDE